MSRTTAIDTAINFLRARKNSRGDYIYFDEGAGRFYVSSAPELAELGKALEAVRPDAYSHWCAETCAGEAELADLDARVIDWSVEVHPQLDEDGDEAAAIDWCRPVEVTITVTLGTIHHDSINVELAGAWLGVRPSNEDQARRHFATPYADIWCEDETRVDVGWVDRVELLEMLDPKALFEAAEDPADLAAEIA
jgi:hypothetical protein